MIWCGWKRKENCHVLVNQFHGNFPPKTPSCREINCVFRDVKWCFNASCGLKGLILKIPHGAQSNNGKKAFIDIWKYSVWVKWLLCRVATKLEKSWLKLMLYLSWLTTDEISPNGEHCLKLLNHELQTAVWNWNYHSKYEDMAGVLINK